MTSDSADNNSSNEIQGKYTQRFQALFNSASIGNLLTDADGCILMINDFALNQFGYSEKELLGNRVEMLIPHRMKM